MSERQLEPGRRDHVGHVRPGATRDRVDADPAAGAAGQAPEGVGRGCLGAGQRGGDLEQLVEPVDPLHAVLAEHGGHDVVGAREVTRVRLRHGRALVGAADLDGDDRDLAPCRRVGGELQRPPVLEALDVAGDGARGPEAREVVDEVGRLHVGLVAGGRPVRELDADLLSLEHRAALVAALGDERDGLAREVLAEDLERVEVGVGPEDVELTAGDDPLHLRPGAARPSAPTSAEAGREDDGELRLGGHRVAQDRQRLADEDGHQVQLLLDVGQRLGAGASRHLGAVGVDEVHRGTALLGPQR